MDDETLTISLKCLFCDCDLEKKSDKDFESGDLIKCQSCNELNDYDSLVEIATGEAMNTLKAKVQKELQSKFGKLFKKK